MADLQTPRHNLTTQVFRHTNAHTKGAPTEWEMGGEWAESGRSGAETPNFKTYKKMWWKSKKCPNTETKDERWMGAGRRLGGGWAEAGRSGAETLNFTNAKKICKMS